MAKRLFRVFNRIHVFLYRLTSGRFGGKVHGLQVRLLTVTGRRTGRAGTVPPGTFEDRGAFIVVASNAEFAVTPAGSSV